MSLLPDAGRHNLDSKKGADRLRDPPSFVPLMVSGLFTACLATGPALGAFGGIVGTDYAEVEVARRTRHARPIVACIRIDLDGCVDGMPSSRVAEVAAALQLAGAVPGDGGDVRVEDHADQFRFAAADVHVIHVNISQLIRMLAGADLGRANDEAVPIPGLRNAEARREVLDPAVG